MRIVCPACSQTLTCEDKDAGKTAHCPRCKQIFRLPNLVEHIPTVILVPKVVPVENNAAELPAPPENPSCVACGYPLSIRTIDRGTIRRCPSCALYFKVPGKRRKGEPSGLPVTVTVSAHIIVWPTWCACCLGPVGDYLKAVAHRVDFNDLTSAAWALGHNQPVFGIMKALGSTETKWWSIPYCFGCIDHIKERTDECSEACCGLDAAVEFVGWNAYIHRFRFYNWQYANRFMIANHGKVLRDG